MGVFHGENRRMLHLLLYHFPFAFATVLGQYYKKKAQVVSHLCFVLGSYKMTVKYESN
jgi:hypothetical protein